jgi:hypothetical protein
MVDHGFSLQGSVSDRCSSRLPGAALTKVISSHWNSKLAATGIEQLSERLGQRDDGVLKMMTASPGWRGRG